MKLEVGFGVEEGVFGPEYLREEFSFFQFFDGPLVVVGVVGFEKKLALTGEQLVDLSEEIDLENSAFMVFGFRPRIWAEQVDAMNRFFGEQPLHRVLGFQSQDFSIGDGLPVDFSGDLADTPEQTFDAEEIVLWAVGGDFGEEFAFAATEVDFAGGVVAEDFARVVATEIIGGHEFARLGGSACWCGSAEAGVGRHDVNDLVRRLEKFFGVFGQQVGF